MKTTTTAHTIPTTNDELARDWSGFIAGELRRTGRAKFNAADMFQETFAKLIAADIVGKFWIGVQELQRQNLTVSAVEAHKMLGITLEAFRVFQEGPEALTAVDVKGAKVELPCRAPRYLFADVIALGASTHFPDQGLQVLPTPRPPTLSHWKSFLSAGVRNHSANIQRTYVRRVSKEHQPDYFRQFRTEETGAVEFEERLVDEGAVPAIEQGMAVGLLLRQAPGLQHSKGPLGLGFFELLKEGYSIWDAIKEVKLSRREQKVLAAHLGHSLD